MVWRPMFVSANHLNWAIGASPGSSRKVCPSRWIAFYRPQESAFCGCQPNHSGASHGRNRKQEEQDREFEASARTTLTVRVLSRFRVDQCDFVSISPTLYLIWRFNEMVLLTLSCSSPALRQSKIESSLSPDVGLPYYINPIATVTLDIIEL